MSLKFEADKYVKKKTEYLKKKGINVIMVAGNLKEDNCEVGGMFNSYTMELSVDTSSNIKQWLPTFIHESQHAEQFLKRTQVWMDACAIYRGQDAISIVFNWLDGKEYPDDIVYKSIRLAQKVELDCEKRTVRELINSGLGRYICPLKYTQAANAYIYFYNMVYINRKWFGTESTHQSIIDRTMPDHFNNDYTKIPMDYYRACMKYCYK